MKKTRQKHTTEKKEMAFSEFKTGDYTQREVARKHNIPEWELSKYISEKFSLCGYPKF